MNAYFVCYLLMKLGMFCVLQIGETMIRGLQNLGCASQNSISEAGDVIPGGVPGISRGMARDVRQVWVEGFH